MCALPFLCMEKDWSQISKRKSCKWCFNLLCKKGLIRCKVYKWKRIAFNEDIKILFDTHIHTELERELTMKAHKCLRFNSEIRQVIKNREEKIETLSKSEYLSRLYK